MKRDNDVETLIDGLTKLEAEAYRYMRDRYETLTNNSEIDSTEFDDRIESEASEKYSISKEQAKQIYIDTEMKIHKMRMDRLN